MIKSPAAHVGNPSGRIYRLLPSVGLILSCPTRNVITMDDILGSRPARIQSANDCGQEKWSDIFSIKGPFNQSSSASIECMSNSSSGCIPCPTLSLETEISAHQPPRAIGLQESFEEWVYSVIAASAVVALPLGILNQPGSPAPGAQSARPEWTNITEHPSPSQGKDGKFQAQ
jgi:hypothetical protein